MVHVLVSINDLDYNTNNQRTCQHIILKIKKIRSFQFSDFSAHRKADTEQNKTVADESYKEAEMRKDKDSYTTKGKEIPTLREGGFTYSADQKMTNCGGQFPSQKASSKAQSKMSSKASNSMSSKTQNSASSKYGDPSHFRKNFRYVQHVQPEYRLYRFQESREQKSGSATDCR